MINDHQSSITVADTSAAIVACKTDVTRAYTCFVIATTSIGTLDVA